MGEAIDLVKGFGEIDVCSITGFYSGHCFYNASKGEYGEVAEVITMLSKSRSVWPAKLDRDGKAGIATTAPSCEAICQLSCTQKPSQVARSVALGTRSRESHTC